MVLQIKRNTPWCCVLVFSKINGCIVWLNHNFLSIKQKWRTVLGRWFVNKLYLSCRMSDLDNAYVCHYGLPWDHMSCPSIRTAEDSSSSGWMSYVGKALMSSASYLPSNVSVTVYMRNGNIQCKKIFLYHINILCVCKSSLPSLLTTVHCVHLLVGMSCCRYPMCWPDHDTMFRQSWSLLVSQCCVLLGLQYLLPW